MPDFDTRVSSAQQAVRDAAIDGIERRRATFSDLEVREDQGKLQFVGHAAVFDRLSGDLGGFVERIQRGAFRKVLDRNPDVRFLVNHEGLPLARTTNGTLELREDPRGLRAYAELADTTLGRDLATLVKRGDVSQMSFAFRLNRDAGGQDVWEEEGDQLVRTIVSFSDLFDVSAVTFPAYEHTDANMLTTARLHPTFSPVGRRVANPSTGDYENALEGIQSIAEAMEASLAQVGFGDIDEPGDGEDVAAGPFSDEDYTDALETLQSLVEAAEGLLDAVGFTDPDEAADAAEAGSEPARNLSRAQRVARALSTVMGAEFTVPDENTPALPSERSDQDAASRRVTEADDQMRQQGDTEPLSVSVARMRLGLRERELAA